VFPKGNPGEKRIVTGLYRDMEKLYSDKVKGVLGMKRKVMMMGLAMVTGLPHAVCVGSGNEGPAQTYSFWNTSYMPHYGAEGAAKPLMDHISVAGAPPGQGISNTWRLEFVPPTAVSSADDPLTANDKRVGFSLKLDF